MVIGQVNGCEEKELAKLHKISLFPTIQLFKEGKMMAEFPRMVGGTCSALIHFAKTGEVPKYWK